MKRKTSDQISAEIIRHADQLFGQQVRWRRHLHAYPELSTREFATTDYLKQQLKSMKATILPLRMPTGVLAEVHGQSKGRTVAIRSDIDALPIVEKSGVSFRSKNAGCMHACGHDMHMATVLGTAAILAKMKSQFVGTVRFIFQPAEEMPFGGARPMIANGALKNVSAILGLHVDPHVGVGRIGLRDGVTMASVYDFDLHILGLGGHAARPHTAVDAITTAAEVIESLQKVVSREIDPVQPVVMTFGKISGGAARNVIADRVILTGTSRTLSPESARRIPALIRRTVAGVCRARGAKFEMHEIARYPVLRNHAKVNRLFANNFDQLFGGGEIETTELVLGGEDFACYLEKVPGAMFRLGIRNMKIGADKPWHSDKFMADEQALRYGSALLAATAIAALES
jgi:amidohydrolase